MSVGNEKIFGKSVFLPKSDSTHSNDDSKESSFVFSKIKHIDNFGNLKIHTLHFVANATAYKTVSEVTRTHKKAQKGSKMCESYKKFQKLCNASFPKVAHLCTVVKRLS